ncbi:MAG: hypothetical protein ACJ77K_17870 [Bacteroidia bacterium]
MKTVLLVFDDPRELEFISAGLTESNYDVYAAQGLRNALISAERIIPDLIVVNTQDKKEDLRDFNNQVKTERLGNSSVISFIELEDYLKRPGNTHFVIKPVRPKLLLSLIRSVMNDETVDWLPAFH